MKSTLISGCCVFGLGVMSSQQAAGQISQPAMVLGGATSIVELARSGAGLPPLVPGGDGPFNVAYGQITDGTRPDLIVGNESGPPVVRVYANPAPGSTPTLVNSFFAYAPTFLGGVRVAAGDVNNDGVDDIIVGAGPGGGPHIKVFDGTTMNTIASFFAFTQSFQGGVYVAGGDVNGDGFADIVIGAGPGGGPNVQVYDGKALTEASGDALVRSFFAYSPAFTGGVRVGAGDVDGDGLADIITGSGPGAAHVKVFSGRTGAELASFFAYGMSYTGGVFVAAGDVDGDDLADVVTTSATSTPHVKVFSGGALSDAAPLPMDEFLVTGFGAASAIAAFDQSDSVAPTLQAVLSRKVHQNP